MTGISAAGNTPANVAKLATKKRHLTTGNLSLIGVFGPHAHLMALVRKPGGRYRRVKSGEVLSEGRIIGIDEKGVMLEKNGRTRRLSLFSG